MNPGIRILVALGSVTLFLGLRLLALFRFDHALLSWLAGGTHAAPVPLPVRTDHPELRRR
ncbi:MAG TPA: hypothetical protein VFA75_08515 [Nevskia sp.]|jgi:hypothetical protein|nr:hypothetical protein [Nevskia sp.]